MKETNTYWMQQDLAKWLEDTHKLKLSQPAISKIVKNSIDHQGKVLPNPNVKHQKQSGSVDMDKIEASLPWIREELDKWAWKDIYNMDETGLFYRMQADNSLATKQLEGCKQNKERITIFICCNGDGSDKPFLWIIANGYGHVFLDHPKEQQEVYALIEEEIIAGIRQEAQGDNQEDDSVEIEKVSCQEASSTLDQLKMFWIQQEGDCVD
ncbi:hypothetical protein BUALT_Bualt08G0022400 [Buddleja alternifolia]|uniref:Transposase n=1 Tax=Buddleja alternifolia TaxID=168488 RepID=A0AAV6X4N0_9LAMI|nr:hypothetical protein BUALT_Bualt08G0022400 [Buddleja alternifolia]